jgi:NhaP-type Na+/H+ and K+/H+ antiporter
MAQAFRLPLVVGDHVLLDGAELCVRAMDGPRVRTVGLKLPDAPVISP